MQNANPNKLAFALGNVTYNPDSGVAVTYTVKESKSIESGYEEKVTANAGEVAEMPLPDDGSSVHYYQVVIRYRDAQ